MVLKNFNILGVHWKILLLRGVTKNQYRGEDCLKRGGLWQFADLMGGGIGKEEGGVFEGVDTPIRTMPL